MKLTFKHYVEVILNYSESLKIKINKSELKTNANCSQVVLERSVKR